jgi:hypothetical protein
MEAESFVYWYVAGFLMTFGLFCIFRNSSIMRSSCYFRLELKDPAVAPRVESILARREALEGLSGRQGMWCGAGFLLFGILTLAHVVSPILADALACATCASIFAISFATVRNRSDRRAASLTPRRFQRVIPVPALIGAFVSSLVPLLLIRLPAMLVPSVIASLSSLVICVAASHIAGMAAILVGDDIDMELFVDERVRRARACAALALSYAISPVFVGVASSRAMDAPEYSVALLLASILCVLYIGWFLVAIRGFASRTHGAPV